MVEGDDQNDPIADATRSILDGHIVLSRNLAEAGIYPAVSVEASISRVMSSIVDDRHAASATNFKKLYSTYEQNRDLINIGAYEAGSDPVIDMAIEYFPLLQKFIQQASTEKSSFQQSLEMLHGLLAQEEN